MDNKEHALRGWNWGKAEFGKAELAFNVQNRPAFEIPYSEISNTNLAGKNEVAVDFSLPADGNDTGTNGHLGGARARGKKAGGARDQLVEMRFYIPGTATKKEKKEDGEDVTDGEDAEEQNAANLFYETLMEKAEIGEVAGDTYATFLDILHLTPRLVTALFLKFKAKLMNLQRTIRYRYVREILPVTWKNLRLQDTIRIDQKVYGFTEARRYPYPHHNRAGPSPTAGSNKISFPSYAVQER